MNAIRYIVRNATCATIVFQEIGKPHIRNNEPKQRPEKTDYEKKRVYCPFDDAFSYVNACGITGNRLL